MHSKVMWCLPLHNHMVYLLYIVTLLPFEAINTIFLSVPFPPGPPASLEESGRPC